MPGPNQEGVGLHSPKVSLSRKVGMKRKLTAARNPGPDGQKSLFI